MSACTHCGGTGIEPVHRWTDTEADELERAVREDASGRLENVTVREPVAPPEDELRAEIGVTDG
jgi:hypothetical protein